MAGKFYSRMERTFPQLVHVAEILIMYTEVSDQQRGKPTPRILRLNRDSIEPIFEDRTTCLKQVCGVWSIFVKEGSRFVKRYFFRPTINLWHECKGAYGVKQIVMLVGKRLDGMETIYSDVTYPEKLLTYMNEKKDTKTVDITWDKSTLTMKIHPWMIELVCHGLLVSWTAKDMQSKITLSTKTEAPDEFIQVYNIWYGENIPCEYHNHDLFILITMYMLQWDSMVLRLWCREKMTNLMECHTIPELYDNFI